MFFRYEKPNILPLFKRYQDTYYYIFVAEEAFGNSSSASTSGKKLVNTLMALYAPEEVREPLLEIVHEFGVQTGTHAWYTDSMTLREANAYAEALGFTLELATRVYPIHRERFKERAGPVDRVYEEMVRRYDRNKRAEKWGRY